MSISILAVSGSLRAKSTNTRLLQELTSFISPDMSLVLYDGVGGLPQFNPDNEFDMNKQTKEWIDLVKKSDAIIVACPEYAHGIPGAFKNALDWLVGTDAFIEKPFCLYQACPRSLIAPKALLEVLKTMSGIHVESSDLVVDLDRNYSTAEEKLSNLQNRKKFAVSLSNLCQSTQSL